MNKIRIVTGLLTLLCALPTGRCYTMQTYKDIYKDMLAFNKATGVMATVAGIATLWACAERYQKNKNSRMHKETIATLQQQLDHFMAGMTQLERDRALLSEIAAQLHHIYTRHEATFKVAEQQNNSEAILALCKERVKNNPQFCNAVLNQELQEVQATLKKYITQLQLRLVQWHDGSPCKAQGESLLKQAQLFSQQCSYVLQKLQQEGIYADLALFVERMYKYTYLREQKLLSQPREQGYLQELTRHIRTYDAYFPYIVYAERVKQDKKKLNDLCVQAAHAALAPGTAWVAKAIQQAQEFMDLLHTLLGVVVASPGYAQEQKDKPEFDRQQERLRFELHEKQERLTIELREKQARIEQEKHLTEIKLQEQKNRAEQLAQQQAKLENERRQLELDRHRVQLELERIRDGQTVSDALAHNNNRWQKELDRLKEVHSREMLRLQKDLTHNQTEQQKVNRELTALKNKIVQLTTDLDSLKEAIKQPPFNPDSVEGLTEYLGTLNQKVSHMSQVLA